MVKTILFDVDGVLLSEEHYFDASALTVWEMLISKNYLALAPELFKTSYTESEIKQIRAQVFENDQVLKLQKSRGLNANWDMIYLTFCCQLIHLFDQIKENEREKIDQWLKSPITRDALVEMGQVLCQYKVQMNFSLFIEEFERSSAVKQELLGYLNVLAKEKLGVETSIFDQDRTLWSVCEHVSQEWYVGDENVLESTGRPSIQLGKEGFLAHETTLAPKEDIAELFSFLKNSGYKIGIGTGRPALETVLPFQHLDWLKSFEEKHVVTADEVLIAEREFPHVGSLSKPHPYTYILADQGKGAPLVNYLNTPLPLDHGEEILVVGDSLADLLAARTIGCKFAAVLTGLSGKDARSEFEKHEADYILDSVLDVKNIL